MDLAEEDLMRFLREDEYVDTDGIDRHTLLFSTGVVDSFALVGMMTFIMEKTGIEFDVSDVTLENLDSIDMILRFVSARAVGDE